MTTLSCLGGKIFDGHACVEASQHVCGAPRRNAIENSDKYCERDGFYVQQGTECKNYYFCVTGVRTYLTCPARQVFNGQICVSKEQYTCPGWRKENQPHISWLNLESGLETKPEEIHDVPDWKDWLFFMILRWKSRFKIRIM